MAARQPSPVPDTSPRSLRALLGLVRQARLCWRLLGDRRVPVWTKGILVAALGYVALPFDLAPDAIPFVGQIDDLTLLVAGSMAFVRLSPPTVVREHEDALG